MAEKEGIEIISETVGEDGFVTMELEFHDMELLSKIVQMSEEQGITVEQFIQDAFTDLANKIDDKS